MNSAVRNCVVAMIVSAAAASVYAASDNSFRFIALSDVHFSNYDSKLDQAVIEIKAMTGANKPAAVFVNGDIADTSLASQYDDFIAHVKAPLEAVGIPVYCITGNHDLGGDAAHNTLAMFQSKLGPLYQSVDIGKTHFILTNGNPEGVTAGYGTVYDPNLWAGPHTNWNPSLQKWGLQTGIGQAGFIGQTQLDWIEDDLQSYNNTHAKISIMLDHFPLFSADAGGYGINDYDYFGNHTMAGTKLKQWVNQYGVDVYLYGHRHTGFGSNLHDAAGNVIWSQLATAQDGDTVFDPALLNYTTGVTMDTLIDHSGAGTIYNYVNAQGQNKQGAAGYDVFDVNDYTISHYRKIIDTYGGQLIGPQQEWSLTVPEPATLSLLATGAMALLRRRISRK